jgi:hypothetical protein
MVDIKSRYRSLRGCERFYEKVIKVKADAAALPAEEFEGLGRRDG